MSGTNNNIGLKVALGIFLALFLGTAFYTSMLISDNKKVILSPHSATFTNECTSRMAIETTQNIIDFFENKLNKSMIVKL